MKRFFTKFILNERNSYIKNKITISKKTYPELMKKKSNKFSRRKQNSKEGVQGEKQKITLYRTKSKASKYRG